MSGSGRLKLFFPGGKHSVYKFFAGDLHELMKKLTSFGSKEAARKGHRKSIGKKPRKG